MPNAADILWFKLQFGSQIEQATAGTPFDLDMLTAIACQETGHIWSTLRRKGMGAAEILALCVGDTLDANKGRTAFPTTKAELVAAADGAAMFQIGRKALEDMAAHIPGFGGAVSNPNKFCHGYGVFQYDLQFFKTNPQHFLQQRYAQFGPSIDLAVGELKRGLKKIGLEGRAQLSPLEMAHVAIAYNTGGFNPARGLKQGHKDGQGRFYGELYFDFLTLSRSVAVPSDAATPGRALTPPPSPVTANGELFEVDTREGLLNVRRTPVLDRSLANFTGVGLPDGQIVRAVGTPAQNGFLEIQTSLAGALVEGFVSTDFLKKAGPRVAPPQPAAAPVEAPAGLTAVLMPRKAGTVTKRVNPAGAHSLNEAGQPGRKGDTPAKLCAELTAISAWLDVENPAHARYQPHDGLTFCNIYAHDYCHLAGVYLPRVWWTPRAVLAIGQGQAVEPKIGASIAEMRANDLFRWLRDFGPGFGWRQTGTLDKLQQQANQGGLGLIVARRKEDGRSGHIVAVVPETDDHQAKRDGAGAVTAALQSQAGAKNGRYLTTANWWVDDKFAEAAFWIHA